MHSSWVMFSEATSCPATFFLTSTGTISSLNLPVRVAIKAFLCELTAYSSSSWRVSLYISARFSAVRPMIWLQMGSVRPSHRVSMKVVWRSLRPQRAPRTMYGALDMLSDPPHMKTSPSPAWMA